MPEGSMIAVELQLADSGRDLAGALDAAEYGRFIHVGEPVSEAEAQAIAAFCELFASATEAWPESPAPARTGMLARLGARLEALERLRLFVHWGSVQLAIETVTMPVAILAIGRSDGPTVSVWLPHAGEAAGEAPTRH